MTKSGGQFALASPRYTFWGDLSPCLPRDLRPWLPRHGRGSNFQNPIQPTTLLTQPNPTHHLIKKLRPNPLSIWQSWSYSQRTNYQAYRPNCICWRLHHEQNYSWVSKASIGLCITTHWHSHRCWLHLTVQTENRWIYIIFIRHAGRKQSNKNITGEYACCGDLDPTKPTVIMKIFDPTQPNPWIDPTHGHVWDYLCICARYNGKHNQTESKRWKGTSREQNRKSAVVAG